MSPASPLHHSQLIFPSAHTNLNSTLTSLKRSDVSIKNRLHSINYDAAFVEQVSEVYQLPLVANERCGSWYITPELKAESVYFKSTDGHYSQWGFSLRRLNFHIVDVVGEQGGCIIVDSTRRGKNMPDALSKTVPIWTAVLNRYLFPDRSEFHALQTPDDVVSPSEHEQIEERLPAFLAELRSFGLDVESLRSGLRGKPMEVAWATPDSMLSTCPKMHNHSNLIVLCTASDRSLSGESSFAGYVQGAADDSESWAHGLTPEIFHDHKRTLLSAAEDELAQIISTLISKSAKMKNLPRQPTLIQQTGNIWIGSHAAAEMMHADFDIVVTCSDKPTWELDEKLKDKHFHLDCTTGKVGSRQLRWELHKVDRLPALLMSNSRVMVTCQTGTDLAVGVALVIICLHFREHGSLQQPGEVTQPVTLTKAVIKQRLSWITMSMPDAAPTRATLQSVNAFLLG